MDRPPLTDGTYQTFMRLFDTYKMPVHSYIQTITGDHHVAEELTQELFIRLWHKRDKYQEITNIDQYIYRMAHNACMNWFSKLALDTRLAGEVKKRFGMESNNVEEHMDYQEAKVLLEKALDSLSLQRRKVFELSRKEGLRIPEIADRLGISTHTANHHLVAALSQLRAYFLMYANDKTASLLLALLALLEK